MKKLWILKDFETKISTNLLDYQDKPTFKVFFLPDGKQGSEVEGSISKQRFVSLQPGQKVNHTKNAKEPNTLKSKKAKVISFGIVPKVHNERDTKQAITLNLTTVSCFIGPKRHDLGKKKSNIPTELDLNTKNTESMKE